MNILVKLGLMKSQFHKDIARSAHILEFTAAAIESMLMSGEYAGVHMCRVLARSDRYTKEQVHFMQGLIMDNLHGEDTLDCYLNRGKKYGQPGYIFTIHTYEATKGLKNMERKAQLTDLESRLIKSMWYWNKIREFRHIAAVYRRDLPTIK